MTPWWHISINDHYHIPLDFMIQQKDRDLAIVKALNDIPTDWHSFTLTVRKSSATLYEEQPNG